MIGKSTPAWSLEIYIRLRCESLTPRVKGEGIRRDASVRSPLHFILHLFVLVLGPLGLYQLGELDCGAQVQAPSFVLLLYDPPPIFILNI